MATLADTRGLRFPGASALENNIVGIVRSPGGNIVGFALYGKFIPLKDWDNKYKTMESDGFDTAKMSSDSPLYKNFGVTVFNWNPLYYTENVQLEYPDTFKAEGSHTTHDDKKPLAGLLFVKNYTINYKGVEFAGGTQIDIKLRIMVVLKKPIKAVDILPRPLMVLDSLIRSALRKYCVDKDIVEFMSKDNGQGLQDGLTESIKVTCRNSADQCGYALREVTFEDYELKDPGTIAIVKEVVDIQKALQSAILTQKKIQVERQIGQAEGEKIAAKGVGESEQIKLIGEANAISRAAMLKAEAEGLDALRRVLGNDFALIQQVRIAEAYSQLQPGATLVLGNSNVMLPINPGSPDKTEGDKKVK